MVKEIVVSVDDEVGVLADITQTLAEAGVNIETISVDGLGDRGVIILTTDSYDTAMNALRQAKFELVTHDAMVLRLEDKPGALGQVAAKLRDAQVNVQSLHVLKSDGDYVRVAITVDDREKAEAMLDAGELG